jgi:hypothetical protein
MEQEIRWDNTRGVLEQYAQHLVEKYRENLAKGNRNASSKLADTVKAEVKVEDTVISVELTLQDYWYYVDNGRKAGKMPPISKIEEWIKIKPITLRSFGKSQKSIPSPRSVAFLIARKIGREGTKGTHDLRDASDFTYNAFRERLEQAIANDIGEYTASIFRGAF